VVAARYLSKDHRDGRFRGCPFAALGSELARADQNTRAVATERLLKIVDSLAQHFKGRRRDLAKRQAMVALSTMVGALTLSRLMTQTELSDLLLQDAAKHVTADNNKSNGADHGRQNQPEESAKWWRLARSILRSCAAKPRSFNRSQKHRADEPLEGDPPTRGDQGRRTPDRAEGARRARRPQAPAGATTIVAQKCQPFSPPRLGITFGPHRPKVAGRCDGPAHRRAAIGNHGHATLP
jgi:hypothetical protein